MLAAVMAVMAMMVIVVRIIIVVIVRRRRRFFPDDFHITGIGGGKGSDGNSQRIVQGRQRKIGDGGSNVSLTAVIAETGLCIGIGADKNEKEAKK